MGKGRHAVEAFLFDWLASEEVLTSKTTEEVAVGVACLWLWLRWFSSRDLRVQWRGLAAQGPQGSVA